MNFIKAKDTRRTPVTLGGAPSRVLGKRLPKRVVIGLRGVCGIQDQVSCHSNQTGTEALGESGKVLDWSSFRSGLARAETTQTQTHGLKR